MRFRIKLLVATIGYHCRKYAGFFEGVCYWLMFIAICAVLPGCASETTEEPPVWQIALVAFLVSFSISFLTTYLLFWWTNRRP